MACSDTLDLWGNPEPKPAEFRKPKGGKAGRDKALTALEQHRADVVATLRAKAMQLFRVSGQPVCVNDIRHVLADLKYEGDPRILGAAFPTSMWLPVGWTTVSGSAANARPVRTFVPKKAVG